MYSDLNFSIMHIYYVRDDTYVYMQFHENTIFRENPYQAHSWVISNKNNFVLSLAILEMTVLPRYIITNYAASMT